jgi:hypothetical protein
MQTQQLLVSMYFMTGREASKRQEPVMLTPCHAMQCRNFVQKEMSINRKCRSSPDEEQEVGGGREKMEWE